MPNSSSTSTSSSRATIFKPPQPRPRIDQLTTEQFEKGSDEKFANVIVPPEKYAKAMTLKIMEGRTTEPPVPEGREQADRVAPRVDIDLDKIAQRSVFDDEKSADRLAATWMGHASFLVQVDGVNILTDPVFSDRAAPVQFAGPKRFVPAPCKVEELPRVDIVTISHNHYDHLDTDTVEKLHKTFNPVFVVPRGMKSRWFTTLGWPESDVEHRVVELGWYKCVEISVPSQQQDVLSQIVQVTFCPAQHWTQRGLSDQDLELWGSFVVEHYRTKVIQNQANRFFYHPKTNTTDKSDDDIPLPTFVARWFHDGDTGYNTRYFKEIGQEFGRPDVDDLSPGKTFELLTSRDTDVSSSTGTTSPATTTNAAAAGISPGDADPTPQAENVNSTKTTPSSTPQEEQQQKQQNHPVVEIISPIESTFSTSSKQQAHQLQSPNINESQKQPVFDLALIPIGAYCPRWYLKDQHVDPDEAVQIYQDLGAAKLAIGMHWGTFVLSDEPIDEPPKLLREACERRGVAEGRFIAPKHGETYEVVL